MLIREAQGQLDIVASPAELQAIAAAIERAEAGQRLSFAADHFAEPRPFQRCLTALDVQVSAGPVRVAIEDSRVIVTGSKALMDAFASSFKFAEGSRSGLHAHHEWFEGITSIANDSIPLVVGVE